MILCRRQNHKPSRIIPHDLEQGENCHPPREGCRSGDTSRSSLSNGDMEMQPLNNSPITSSPGAPPHIPASPPSPLHPPLPGAVVSPPAAYSLAMGLSESTPQYYVIPHAFVVSAQPSSSSQLQAPPPPAPPPSDR